MTNDLMLGGVYILMAMMLVLGALMSRREPAASVVACENLAVAEYLQKLCHTSAFRPYTLTDVVGAELGGAVKNVIALACCACLAFCTTVPARCATVALVSSIVVACASRYPVRSRISIREGWHSTAMHEAPAIVAASGWAPPIPPSPAVRIQRPFRLPPKCWRPISAKVS